MDSVVKDHMIKFVQDIKDSGHNLDDAPVHLMWDWEELPGVEFQMLIRGTAHDQEVERGEVVITAYDDEDDIVSISRTVH